MLNKLSPTIAIIDSGIGGISILNKLIEKYKYGNYIYYADNLYMPYGAKSKSFIKNRLLEIIKELKEKYLVDIIIIACNTASATLKNTKIDNVIKLEFNDKEAVYLVTPLTQKILTKQRTISSPTLASSIELNINDKIKLKKIIKREVVKNKLNRLKKLVLGCTHYELVEDLFKMYCNKTEVISNSDYILRNINYITQSDKLSVYIINTKQSMRYNQLIRSLIK